MMKLTNKRSSRAGSRHTGLLGGVAYEALGERRGRDADIDRSRTPLNTYQGIRLAAELIPVMNGEAAAYSEKRKQAGGRALQSTAAIGFATIVKPDGDFIMALSEAERDRFFQDSNEVLDGILGATNIRSRVRHRDERADHEHTFRMGFAPSGKLETAYYFKPQLWRRINVEFPEAMRQRGWDVSDCDVYEPDRADDPAYMAERKAKREKYGRGSAAYKDDQATKKRADADRMKMQAALELAEVRVVKARIAALEAQAAEDRAEAGRELAAVRKAHQEAQERLDGMTQAAYDAGFLAMPIGKDGRTVGGYLDNWGKQYAKQQRAALEKEAREREARAEQAAPVVAHQSEAEQPATEQPASKPKRKLTGSRAARSDQRARDGQSLLNGLDIGQQEDFQKKV